MNQLKRAKIIFLIGIIIIIIFIILTLTFSSTNQKSIIISNITPSLTQEIKNNIDYNIKNYSFNITNKIDFTSIDNYSIEKLDANNLKKFADYLNMNIDNSDKDLDIVQYSDKNDNYIALFNDKVTIKLINKNNPKLNNINKGNVIYSIGSIFGRDLTSYKLVSTIQNPENTTSYFFQYNIRTVPVINDYNNNMQLSVTIDSNNVLRDLKIQLINPINPVKKELTPIDEIEKNFDYIDKGIFPNYNPQSTQDQKGENFKNFDSFQGKVEINNVQLGYLLPKENPYTLTPIYLLNTRFTYDDGHSTSGIIVVNAI